MKLSVLAASFNGLFLLLASLPLIRGQDTSGPDTPIADCIASGTCERNVHALSRRESISSSTCNQQCQQLVLQGAAFEQSERAHSPLDAFYSVPTTFSRSMKPGTLLRVEEHTNLTNYTVPSSLSMSRIMYTSNDINGTIVPVSAYVLWPYSPYVSFPQRKSDAGTPQFPLVAWAHGTAGFFPDCAPSNYRSLQYHFIVPYNLALEGFAVVAPDWAGLGAARLPNGDEIHHPWLNGPAAANDLAYSIEAARKAFPHQLPDDRPFVAMGHSQGGNAAYAFAERQAMSPVPGYRGTISISPPTRVIEQLDDAQKLVASVPPAQVATLPFWALTIINNIQTMLPPSISAVYPSYNFSGFTDLTYDRWNNVLAAVQGCLPTTQLAFAGVPATELVKPGWDANPTVLEWAERVAVSGKNFVGPLLLIVGTDDVVSVESINTAVDRSCKADPDQALEMVTYSNMEHFPVIDASRQKWMDWIKGKFVNEGYNVTCGGKGVCGKKSVVEGFNTNFTLHPQGPNWLVDWVSPTQGWKLVL